MNSGYYVFERVYYEINKDKFTAEEIIQKFETTRSSVMRDIKYLRVFQNYEIIWDNIAKCYVNRGKKKI